MFVCSLLLRFTDRLRVGCKNCGDEAIGVRPVDLFAHGTRRNDVVAGQPYRRISDKHFGVTVENDDGFNLNQRTDKDVPCRQFHRPGVHAGVQRVLRRDFCLRCGANDALRQTKGFKH